jgi:hypothetical protein
MLRKIFFREFYCLNVNYLSDIYNPEEVIKMRDGVFSWSSDNSGTLNLRNLSFVIEEVGRNCLSIFM